MDNNKKDFEELAQEIKAGIASTGDMPVTEFFNLYAEAAAENGDTPDLTYCPILKDSAGGYRVDGYAFDVQESSDSAISELYLAVCEYHDDSEQFSITKKNIEKAVEGIRRFVTKATTSDFIFDLEESSPAFQLAILLKEHLVKIKRIRLVVFTNGVLSLRKKSFPDEKVGELLLSVNVIDIERYSKITSQGNEPVEVNFVEDFGGGIKNLAASPSGINSYKSYLFALPGNVLAEVFARYKNRLLEKNVRTYLQAVTKVNKGILKTIEKEPHMFFAYNNGITATASGIALYESEDGETLIEKIDDFQIVNGGQTTASLNYARDAKSLDLSNVFVQVKLAVVESDTIADVVPKISEYANTQNKVSTADLQANSEIQIQIERVSKQVQTPQRAGELHSSRWFYERARGQFKSLFSYKTAAERKKLQTLYPRSQLISKTDLAKYEFAFDARPHHVSEGAQKCFSRFVQVLNKYSVKDINDQWFRRAVAKAILFNEVDKAVNGATWYQEDRGYKAPIVAYTVSAVADGFRSQGLQIDLDRIWKEQSLDSNFLNWVVNVAQNVAKILKSPHRK
ncbi:AIPR family protein [Salinimonas marina]|uniref:AIPR family protein n=1 Tax=Salinimonas marina TaxID=2785918 RepID=A0A7S9DYQ3_9ALTE|nr:AIPR family protein [Salinimonas marina]QPG05740.1 AIPR family protein [Salinimonas marina]